MKVEWEDSTSYRGWRDDAKELGPAKCMSCGVLVRVKKGCIGVTHSITDTEEFGGIMIIPRKAIRKMEIISTFRK